MRLATILSVACVTLGCSSLPTIRGGVDAGEDVPCDAVMCGASCVDLSRDRAHCGACGNACNEGVDCIRGVCSRRVVSLALELNTVCARVDDGSSWCWGNNSVGECGDGSDETTRPVPVRVGVPLGATVVAGWARMGVIVDGEVRCWGRNDDRGLIDDARNPVRAVTTVPFPGRAIALDLGPSICALLDDAAVYCRPTFGGEVAHPYLRWMDRVVAMDSGWGHLCALRDDGTVGCGGRRGTGAFGDGDTTLAGIDYVLGPIEPVGLPRVVQIVSSADGMCARTVEGALWCWGQAHLHSPDRTVWAPERVEAAGTVREMWSAGQGFIVRRSDGTLISWGVNEQGIIGDGTTTHRDVPVRPTALDEIAADIVTIVAGPGAACALLRDQTVRCWGSNINGQLGVGTVGGRSLTPVSPHW